ncbi:uncharacterized protein LOC119923051 [Tachyglossus aculeatus]|uniref:uncharacterized protein LOC119923051 n=1 Tax=Tachyglossus aculeatus TaxID=9261 RepID=UPI0018F5A771|nr:uncharacterized protein LOC119923051 [Tachyglossus aculeatus]
MWAGPVSFQPGGERLRGRARGRDAVSPEAGRGLGRGQVAVARPGPARGVRGRGPEEGRACPRGPPTPTQTPTPTRPRFPPGSAGRRHVGPRAPGPKPRQRPGAPACRSCCCYCYCYCYRYCWPGRAGLDRDRRPSGAGRPETWSCSTWWRRSSLTSTTSSACSRYIFFWLAQSIEWRYTQVVGWTLSGEERESTACGTIWEALMSCFEDNHPIFLSQALAYTNSPQPDVKFTAVLFFGETPNTGCSTGAAGNRGWWLVDGEGSLPTATLMFHCLLSVLFHVMDQHPTVSKKAFWKAYISFSIYSINIGLDNLWLFSEDLEFLSQEGATAPGFVASAALHNNVTPATSHRASPVPGRSFPSAGAAFAPYTSPADVSPPVVPALGSPAPAMLVTPAATHGAPPPSARYCVSPSASAALAPEISVSLLSLP